MAEALGFAIVSAIATEAAASTVIVGSLTVAGAVGGATLLAGGIALNLIGQALQGDQNKVASQQFSSRQPLPARQRSYGRVKIAGPFVQYETAAGAFIYGIYHGEGPYDSIEGWWLDDTLCTSILAGSLGGLVNDYPWKGYVGIESRLGTDPQSPSSYLLSTAGWDSTHTLTGCCYSAVKSGLPKQKNFTKIYPKQSWSSLRVQVRAAKVRTVADAAQTADPATWAWSDRSSPCIRDFITHPVWGMRVPASLLNDAKWAAHDVLCAEIIAHKDGSQYPRYYLGGTYQLTDDPADTLTAMLATCDGALTLEPDGTIGITGGRFPIATVTITDPNILSMNVEMGGSKLFAFNRLKISYVSPQHDYQQVEGQAWNDVTAQAASGELLEQDFSRPWVQSFNQARRLAKIAMAKGNPAIKITDMVTDLSAASALFEDSIHLVLSLYGIDAVFIVTRAVANIAAGTCTFDMQSLDPAAYSFNPATEEGTAPALPNLDTTTTAPAAPTNLTVAIERRTVSGATIATFLRLTATAPARADLSLIGRYRLVGAVDWTDMATDTDNAFSLTSGVLADGLQYQVQGAVGTYGQALVSDFIDATPSPITATADQNAPAAPTGFTATGSAGAATLSWTNGGSPNTESTRIYRGADSTFANAVLIQSVSGGPNQAGSFVDSNRPAGTYRYWLRAANGSGVMSDPVGPVAVTVV